MIQEWRDYEELQPRVQLHLCTKIIRQQFVSFLFKSSLFLVQHILPRKKIKDTLLALDFGCVYYVLSTEYLQFILDLGNRRHVFKGSYALLFPITGVFWEKRLQLFHCFFHQLQFLQIAEHNYSPVFFSKMFQWGTLLSFRFFIFLSKIPTPWLFVIP